MKNWIADAKMTHYYCPKNRVKALMKHTAIGMTVQRICRWLFHFLLHFGANMEKNIASTSLGFPAYLATSPCDIRDNFPKYVVSLDELDMSRNGIKHRNIRDFLLAEEWN